MTTGAHVSMALGLVVVGVVVWWATHRSARRFSSTYACENYIAQMRLNNQRTVARFNSALELLR